MPVNTHINDFNNPHQLDKVDIDLGLVENHPMANVDEATDGVANDRYVSPNTTGIIIDETLRELNIIDGFGNVIAEPAGPAQIAAARTPGYQRPIAGDYSHGYFGTVSDADLITATELVNLSGIGTVDPLGFYEYTHDGGATGSVSHTERFLQQISWMKFSIDGKILLVASHPIKVVSFNQLDAINAIYGDNEFTIKGNQYKLRLLSGNGAAENIIVGGRGYKRSTVLTNGDGKNVTTPTYPFALTQSEWDRTIMKVAAETPLCQDGANWSSYNTASMIPNRYIQRLEFVNPVTYKYANTAYTEAVAEFANVTVSSVSVFRRGRFDNNYVNMPNYEAFVVSTDPNISYYGTVTAASRDEKNLAWRPVLELII